MSNAWLNADEMRLWRTFLETNSRVMQAIESDLKNADAGLALDDYEVLVYLSESPDHRLLMSDLSDRLLNSRSRLSQRIDRMQKRDLVAREACPEDGRRTWAVLTPHGRATLDAEAPGHKDSVRRHLMGALNAKQIKTLGDLLNRVADHHRDAET